MSVDRTSETRHLYDTVAATYAQLVGDMSLESPLEIGLIDLFIAGLPDSSLPVLDAGCGTGRMLRHLSDRGVSGLVGADLSSEMLEFAKTGDPAVQTIRADFRALPFPDVSFRAVLCWYAIIHSPADEVASAFEEFRRVLAPGGLVLLAFQAGSGEREVPGAYGHDLVLRGVLHEPHDVVGLLLAAGYEVTATVDRAPLDGEQSRQGFVMARRNR